MRKRPSAQSGSQLAFLEASWCPEVFFGGERGGGKSYAQCLYQADGATRYGQHYRGIMTRKTYVELEQLQESAREVFGFYGATYHVQPSAERQISNAWYWPNGAVTRMRYLEHEDDYLRYHGFEFSHISLDEVTEYAAPDGLLKMMSTLRSRHGVPCTLRASGNPGGRGHAWVKARYIDVGAPCRPHVDPDSGLERMFIPSKLSENVALVEADPLYRNRLMAATAGNDALRKAWMDGDWDIVAGAFFTGWNRAKHVIRPFTVPEHWVKFGAFDWGSARPFAHYWIAVADGETDLPRGALVVYREWYGMAEGRYNVGLKLDAEQVADGIKERTHEKLDYSVSDPACFKRDGGPSIAERMAERGVHFRPGDNQRVSGWDQVAGRLSGDDGIPMLYIFDTCTHLIRTLPLMQHDAHRIEDIDSDLEDHCCDALRYGCMSRPWTRALPKPAEPLVLVHDGWNWGDLVKRNREHAA